MAAKRVSLGRNLSALLSSANLVTENPAKTDAPSGQDFMHQKESFSQVGIQHLQPSPYQPRRDMDQTALEELSLSIQQQGVLQPLLVRQVASQHYEILAGERRWRAAQLAGLSEIPVIIKSVDDESAMAIALIENLQREDLNALDQAYAMQRLVNDFDLTHQQVADMLGKSRAAISNHLRLISLSDIVKQFLEHGDLDMGHARALLSLTHEQQNEVAQWIVSKGLSVRETEQWIQRLNKKGQQLDSIPMLSDPNRNPSYSTQFQSQLNHLAQHFQMKVTIQQQKRAPKGTLSIHFNNQEELETILNKIG